MSDFKTLIQKAEKEVNEIKDQLNKQLLEVEEQRKSLNERQAKLKMAETEVSTREKEVEKQIAKLEKLEINQQTELDIAKRVSDANTLKDRARELFQEAETKMLDAEHMMEQANKKSAEIKQLEKEWKEKAVETIFQNLKKEV